VDWLNGLVAWPILRRSLLEESPLVHPAVTFRRQAVLEAGLYLDDPGPEDWDLWLRMVRAGWVLESIPQEVLIWNDGPQRLTRTHGRYSLDAQMALRVRHLKWLVPEASRCGVNVWSAGESGRRLMRHLRSVDVPVHVILDVDPRRFGQRLHGAEIRPFHELLFHRGRPTLVALGTREAKTKVRDWCVQHGLVEGEEIWFLS
jgi:cellulose synthase/poly-beta-1,6-N-acetylglucosamine synthase-like glycosyltransferase